MGRKTAVREVQVEEVVNKREEKIGGQAGEVHLGVLYFERHIKQWSLELPDRGTTSEAWERMQEQARVSPTGQRRGR